LMMNFQKCGYYNNGLPGAAATKLWQPLFYPLLTINGIFYPGAPGELNL
jgi:hypothetical protein